MAGRTTPKRVRPAQDHSAATVDAFLEQAAQREHQRAVEAYKADLARAETEADAALRDPGHNQALGLPPELPESTIAILKTTMALDRIGPAAPHPETAHRRWTPGTTRIRYR